MESVRTGAGLYIEQSPYLYRPRDTIGLRINVLDSVQSTQLDTVLSGVATRQKDPQNYAIGAVWYANLSQWGEYVTVSNGAGYVAE